MKLKEIKFKLTKSKDPFTKPTYAVPEEEIIEMNYECRTNDDGKNTPEYYTDGFYMSSFLKKNGTNYSLWNLILPIIYEDNYICRIEILISADINYEISELVFEVDGKIITIKRDSMEVIRELVLVYKGIVVDKIEIKDGSLD